MTTLSGEEPAARSLYDDAARGDLLVPLWVNGWRSKGRGRPLGWDTLL